MPTLKPTPPDDWRAPRERLDSLADARYFVVESHTIGDQVLIVRAECECIDGVPTAVDKKRYVRDLAQARAAHPTVKTVYAEPEIHELELVTRHMDDAHRIDFLHHVHAAKRELDATVAPQLNRDADLERKVEETGRPALTPTVHPHPPTR